MTPVGNAAGLPDTETERDMDVNQDDALVTDFDPNHADEDLDDASLDQRVLNGAVQTGIGSMTERDAVGAGTLGHGEKVPAGPGGGAAGETHRVGGAYTTMGGGEESKPA